MNTATITLAAAAAVSFAILFWRYQQQPRSRLPFPPGPKQEWLFGNARQMPTSAQWLTFAKWGEQYGEHQIRTGASKRVETHRRFPFLGAYVFARVFGAPFLILNSAKSAIDLLDRRSTIYSDRKDSVMTNELYVLYHAPLPHARTDLASRFDGL